MASLYELFGTEKNIEDDGAWIPQEDCEFNDGTCPEFKVRRIGGINCPYNKEYEKLLAPHRKRARKMRGGDGDISTQLQEWAMLEAFKNVSIVGWRNVPKNLRADGEKGELLEFNKENVQMLFDKMPTLASVLIGDATELKHYQDEALEEDAKNL